MVDYFFSYFIFFLKLIYRSNATTDLHTHTRARLVFVCFFVVVVIQVMKTLETAILPALCVLGHENYAAAMECNAVVKLLNYHER